MNKFIRAQISLGNLDEIVLRIFNNAYSNQILFLDGKTYLENEPSRNQAFQVIKSRFPLMLAAQSKGFHFNIKVEIGDMGTFITLYPSGPFKKKKGIDCAQEELDLGFYIERMIELCENFPIYELVTGEKKD